MVLKSLFGTSGIRGEAEKLFTNLFCFYIAQAFVFFLEKHQQSGPVAVGLDPRESSPKILEAIESGLLATGRKVVDQGVVPTPALNWLLKVAPYAGSVMVTGSHIAANLNGLKFFAFQEEILKKHEKEISQIYFEIKGKKEKPKKVLPLVEEKIEEKKAKEAYQEMLINLADKPLPKWKLVVVDTGNGGQSETMPQVLQRLGLQIKTINDSLQGEFIARDTETEGVLQDLQTLVKKEKADLGIAYDYDGDRVIFIDEKGEFIPGDYSGTLIAKDSDTPVVVTPINTSQVVDQIGKKVVRTRVGSPYVVEAMKKHQATFGFEANGGGISAEIMLSRDGGSTTIKMLNLLKKQQRSLSFLVATLPRFFSNRLKVDCPKVLNQAIMEAAEKQYKGKKVEKLDGLKIWLDSTSWLLFRPSSNEAAFRVFAEAESQAKAKTLAEKGVELVNKIIQKGEK